MEISHIVHIRVAVLISNNVALLYVCDAEIIGDSTDRFIVKRNPLVSTRVVRLCTVVRKSYANDLCTGILEHNGIEKGCVKLIPIIAIAFLGNRVIVPILDYVVGLFIALVLNEFKKVSYVFAITPAVVDTEVYNDNIRSYSVVVMKLLCTCLESFCVKAVAAPGVVYAKLHTKLSEHASPICISVVIEASLGDSVRTIPHSV